LVLRASSRNSIYKDGGRPRFAGLAILVTAIAAKDDCFKAIGLGVLAFGWGEWLNHRMETEFRHGGTLTTYERVNRPLGLAIAGVGIVVVAFGLYCLFGKMVSAGTA
jgi:hypothetical protein